MSGSALSVPQGSTSRRSAAGASSSTHAPSRARSAVTSSASAASRRSQARPWAARATQIAPCVARGGRARRRGPAGWSRRAARPARAGRRAGRPTAPSSSSTTSPSMRRRALGRRRAAELDEHGAGVALPAQVEALGLERAVASARARRRPARAGRRGARRRSADSRGVGCRRTLTSVTTPRVPYAPVMSLARSYPATFLMTFEPARGQRAVGQRDLDAEHEVARAAVAVAQRPRVAGGDRRRRSSRRRRAGRARASGPRPRTSRAPPVSGQPPCRIAVRSPTLCSTIASSSARLSSGSSIGRPQPSFVPPPTTRTPEASRSAAATPAASIRSAPPGPPSRAGARGRARGPRRTAAAWA